MARPGRDCSIANALVVVGERWSLLAMREVMFGVYRFDQIAHNTGASRDILATRLRTLVEHGVLERRQYEEHPPRYEYVPTASGRELRHVLMALMEWGDRHATTGPPPTVLTHSCGAEFHPRTSCAHCRQPIESGDTSALRIGAVP